MDFFWVWSEQQNIQGLSATENHLVQPSTKLKLWYAGDRNSSVLVLFPRGFFVALGNHSGPDCSPSCTEKLSIREVSCASVLVQKNVQRLLVNSRVGKFNFRLRLLCSVNNRGAADFGQFLPVSVKSPTADFVVANQVFDEKNAPVEAKGQLVE